MRFKYLLTCSLCICTFVSLASVAGSFGSCLLRSMSVRSRTSGAMSLGWSYFSMMYPTNFSWKALKDPWILDSVLVPMTAPTSCTAPLKLDGTGGLVFLDLVLLLVLVSVVATVVAVAADAGVSFGAGVASGILSHKITRFSYCCLSCPKVYGDQFSDPANCSSSLSNFPFVRNSYFVA